MFTGIVQTIGRVASVAPGAATAAVTVEAPEFDAGDIALGDSVCVDGVCLTVARKLPGRLAFDVSPETLAVTAGFAVGREVNLEKSLRLSDPLGGHLVSGHVDGVGEVIEVREVEGNRAVIIRFPAALGRYLARKGSIAVNGVSLTVNTVGADRFSVNLIPHTLAVTNLKSLAAGSRVNLEVDLVARYVERMLSNAPDSQ
ncbi:MAG TPA: riboflavin synthase [Burkholderiales bacterium]|nr:riboflavin synthase [Burkholderiales bacterium]